MEQLQITLRKFSPDWAAWQKIGKSIGDWFFLSPADDRISYKKSLCLSIEKGEIQAALGSRFLSRIKIIGFKKYPSTEEDYPAAQFSDLFAGPGRGRVGGGKMSCYFEHSQSLDGYQNGGLPVHGFRECGRGYDL